MPYEILFYVTIHYTLLHYITTPHVVPAAVSRHGRGAVEQVTECRHCSCAVISVGCQSDSIDSLLKCVILPHKVVRENGPGECGNWRTVSTTSIAGESGVRQKVCVASLLSWLLGGWWWADGGGGGGRGRPEAEGVRVEGW